MKYSRSSCCTDRFCEGNCQFCKHIQGDLVQKNKPEVKQQEQTLINKLRLERMAPLIKKVREQLKERLDKPLLT